MAHVGGDAGGQAAAGGARGHGRAAAPGGGRDRENHIHPLTCLQRNTNHDMAMRGKNKKKITLMKKFRVANEAVNSANQALVDTYNDMWDVGDSFEEALADVDVKKSERKEERRALKKSFGDLIAKASMQKSAVVQLGGEAVPFPKQVLNLLPEALQDMLKEE